MIDQEDKTINYTLSRVPPELWKALRHLSIARDQSVRDTLLDLIREAVETARKATT